VEDFPIPFTLPCSATTSTAIGGSCSIATSANAARPGWVQTGKRAIWELDEIQVFDGGASGVAGAADATPFEDQGVFVP